MRQNKIFLIILLVIYSALIFFGVSHHEPWRDEAHIWVSAQEDSIGEIVQNMRYAPTPILWNLILVPFAKAGLPYISMSILHTLLAIAAVGLLLFISTIPLSVKVFFIFSYYMTYEYAVVARNYVLTALLLFIIASLYKKRFMKPILFAIPVVLLFQTNFYSTVPAGLLVGMFFADLIAKRNFTFKTIVAFLMMLTGAFFTFLALIPEPRYAILVKPESYAIEVGTVVRNAIVPSFRTLENTTVQSPLFFALVTGLTVFVILSLLIMLWRQRFLFFFALVTFAWLLIANVFLHGGAIRHHGLFLIYLMFIVWISDVVNKKKVFLVILSSLLFLSMFFTTYIYDREYHYPFSAAADMARYIKTNDLESETIALFTASDGEAILPYFPDKKFWYPEFGRFDRFHINDWRYQPTILLTSSEVTSRIEKEFPSQLPLLLASVPLESSNWKLLSVFYSNFFWGNATENFWLYQKE